MATSFLIELPKPVAIVVPDTEGEVDGENALPVLTKLASELSAYISSSIAQFERLAVFRELSFQVAYGLPGANPEVANYDRPSDRPGRFGLSASVVGIAARFVLERAVIVGRFGDREPAATDIAALVLTSAAQMQVDAGRELAELSLGGKEPRMGRISIRKAGTSVLMAYHAEQFDFVGYQRMRESRLVDSDPLDNASLQAFAGEIPDEFREISGGMVSDLGFGLDDLLDVISLGYRINVQQESQFVALDIEYFRSFGAVSPRTAAALDYLTFSSEHLTVGDLRPSSTRHQKRRIVTHPFIVHDDILVLNRELLFEALNRWWRYLVNGDWPVPARTREGWPTLNAAITARRNARGTEAFEPFVEAELDRIGLPWGFTSGANRKIGEALITGEIDALVVDAKSGVLWVVEAKDITSDQNLRSLQTELRNMTNHYLPQVTRSASQIQSDPRAVVKHALQGWAQRGKVDADQLRDAQLETQQVEVWKVRPLIVVRDRSAAEFLVDSRLTISTVADLRSNLLDK